MTTFESAVFALLKELEWSGKQYYHDDNCSLSVCPICGGSELLGDDDDVDRGHESGCELNRLIQTIHSNEL